MDSNLSVATNESYLYIQLFFIFVGIVLYVIAIVFFLAIYQKVSLIKQEIFSFIIINVIKSFLDISLSSSIKKELIKYFLEIIEFCLIVIYINKCLTSQKISENSQKYDLEYKYYIVVIIIFITFPYEKVINLSGKYIFSLNMIKIILSFLFYIYINGNMELLLDYLKQKNISNRNGQELNLHNLEEYYYYKQFNIVKAIFSLTLGFTVISNAIKIFNKLFEWQILSLYLTLIFEKAKDCSLIAVGLIFFSTLHMKNLLKADKNKNQRPKVNTEDIGIKEEEASLSSNSLKMEKNTEEKFKKEEKNNADNEQEKIDIKISEETEKLN